MVNSKTVLITGPTSGIGYELAKIFAADGYRLVLVSRRKEELKRVAAELQPDATIISADLSDQKAPVEVVTQLTEQSVEIDCLVNNAGFGLRGAFTETDLTKELDMIQLNIAALTHLTKLLLPGMLKRKSGRILNIASTAAFQPGPFMAVYYATKAYVLSFSEALAEELRGTGVTVTALCPGPTKTLFQDRAAVGDVPLFRRTMAADVVAQIGYKALLAGRPVVIAGVQNAIGAWLGRLLPRPVTLAIVRRIQE